eukprot:1629343-Pyramimonas_sp.AAC.1
MPTNFGRYRGLESSEDCPGGLSCTPPRSLGANLLIHPAALEGRGHQGRSALAVRPRSPNLSHILLPRK